MRTPSTASAAVAINRDDARVRNRQVHQLDVQDVVEMDVRDEALRARHTVAPADALVRLADPLVALPSRLPSRITSSRRPA